MFEIKNLNCSRQHTHGPSIITRDNANQRIYAKVISIVYKTVQTYIVVNFLPKCKYIFRVMAKLNYLDCSGQHSIRPVGNRRDN